MNKNDSSPKKSWCGNHKQHIFLLLFGGGVVALFCFLMVIFVILVEKPLVKSYISIVCFLSEKNAIIFRLIPSIFKKFICYYVVSQRLPKLMPKNIKRDRMRVSFLMTVIEQPRLQTLSNFSCTCCNDHLGRQVLLNEYTKVYYTKLPSMYRTSD